MRKHLKLSSFFKSCLRPYWPQALLFGFISALTGLWVPLHSVCMKLFVDALPGVHTDISELAGPGLGIVLNFIFFDQLPWRSLEYLKYKFFPLFKNKILGDRLQDVLSLPESFFHQHTTGQLNSYMVSLAENTAKVLFDQSTHLIRGIVLLGVSLSIFYKVNVSFFVIMVIWCAAFFIVSLIKSILISRKTQQCNKAEIGRAHV